uniref:LIM zinc-binding domain-containing protein n=1 Tax=Meloidogyne incognita TaxID=6306 RepID=A0A914N727_MELIC
MIKDLTKSEQLVNTQSPTAINEENKINIPPICIHCSEQIQEPEMLLLKKKEIKLNEIISENNLNLKEENIQQQKQQFYHLKCLNCSVCNLDLESEDKCFVKDNKIYCCNCYAKHAKTMMECDILIIPLLLLRLCLHLLPCRLLPSHPSCFLPLPSRSYRHPPSSRRRPPSSHRRRPLSSPRPWRLPQASQKLCIFKTHVVFLRFLSWFLGSSSAFLVRSLSSLIRRWLVISSLRCLSISWTLLFCIFLLLVVLLLLVVVLLVLTRLSSSRWSARLSRSARWRSARLCTRWWRSARFSARRWRTARSTRTSRNARLK